MAYVYWIELKRSPMRWALPLLLGIDLAAIFGRNQYWIGVWPQASAAAQIPSLFFGPALAAAAAWNANRAARRRMGDQLMIAGRPVWQAEAVQAAAMLTYGLAVYALGAVIAAAVSFREAGPGFLWPSYIALGVATLVGCVGVGHALGRWSRNAFLAPVACGVGTFLLIGSLGTSGQLGFVVLEAGPQMRVDTGPLMARLGVALGWLLVAALVPTLLRRSGNHAWRSASQSWAGAAAVCLLLAATVGLFQAGPLRIKRMPPAKPLCSSGTPRVCLWPDDRKYLPAIEAMLAQARKLPPGLFVIPSAVYERGLRHDSKADDFEIIEGSMWSISPNIAGDIISATLPTWCPATSPEAEKRRTQAYFELDTWLEAWLNRAAQPADVHGGPPGVDLAAMGRLITQPESVQVTWVTQRLATIRGTACA